MNPSIIEVGDRYLLAFRVPRSKNVSEIGAVYLDKTFRVEGHAVLLTLRTETGNTCMSAEDPRLVRVGKKIYLLFNAEPRASQGKGVLRRMYLAEIQADQNAIYAKTALQLKDRQTSDKELREKNWVPFCYDNTLLLAYQINPHRIIKPNLMSGVCQTVYNTRRKIEWNYSTPGALFPLRGGSPGVRVDGQYLAFFHSAEWNASPLSRGTKNHHYYTGAYTFSASPPFSVQKISPRPFRGNGFYQKTSDGNGKVVTYPGGFIVDGKFIYLAYGLNDESLCIAKLEKNQLFKSLQQLSPQ